MNRSLSILILLGLSFTISTAAQAKQVSSLTFSHVTEYNGRSQEWAQTEARRFQARIDGVVGTSNPDFHGSADVTVSTRVRNDTYWLPGSMATVYRYTGLVTLRMNNFAYAFDEVTEKFPGMGCDEAEVEGRRLHPHAFYSELESYKEGNIFHRVHGCAFTSYSIVSVKD